MKTQSNSINKSDTASVSQSHGKIANPMALLQMRMSGNASYGRAANPFQLLAAKTNTGVLSVVQRVVVDGLDTANIVDFIDGVIVKLSGMDVPEAINKVKGLTEIISQGDVGRKNAAYEKEARMFLTSLALIIEYSGNLIFQPDEEVKRLVVSSKLKILADLNKDIKDDLKSKENSMLVPAEDWLRKVTRYGVDNVDKGKERGDLAYDPPGKDHGVAKQVKTLNTEGTLNNLPLEIVKADFQLTGLKKEMPKDRDLRKIQVHIAEGLDKFKVSLDEDKPEEYINEVATIVTKILEKLETTGRVHAQTKNKTSAVKLEDVETLDKGLAKKIKKGKVITKDEFWTILLSCDSLKEIRGIRPDDISNNEIACEVNKDTVKFELKHEKLQTADQVIIVTEAKGAKTGEVYPVKIKVDYNPTSGKWLPPRIIIPALKLPKPQRNSELNTFEKRSRKAVYSKVKGESKKRKK